MTAETTNPPAPQTEATPEAVPVTLDGLLARYTEAEDTFTITLSGGEVLTVRALRSSKEQRALIRKAQTVVELCKDGSAPEPWKAYLPALDESDLALAIRLSDLVVNPPITQLEALRMAAQAGGLFLEITAKLDSEVRAKIEAAERKAVEDRKNAFMEVAQ